MILAKEKIVCRWFLLPSTCNLAWFYPRKRRCLQSKLLLVLLNGWGLNVMSLSAAIVTTISNVVECFIPEESRIANANLVRVTSPTAEILYCLLLVIMDAVSDWLLNSVVLMIVFIHIGYFVVFSVWCCECRTIYHPGGRIFVSMM